jgi:uroporphyrinogen decarboxylase
LNYTRQIVKALKDDVLTIVFAKGAWHSLKNLSATGAHCLGVDWCVTPAMARQLAGDKIVLQGNLDPAKLLAPIEVIKTETRKMLDDFGGQRHIANLGHGILPNTPVDHAKAFVDIVKNFKIEDGD